MCHPRFGKQTIPHFSWMEEGPHIKEWGLGKVQLNLRGGAIFHLKNHSASEFMVMINLNPYFPTL